jgi:hypothetical protein
LAEQEYLEGNGSFDGYCQIFLDFFAKHQKGLLPYYAHIAAFIRRFFELEEARDWYWLQENLINLDLIPYHSSNAQGLRLQDPKRFRHTYFKIFLRILEHINPIEPIFFNGFPTLERYLSHSAFQDVISYDRKNGFSEGTIAGKFNFIGLPFLNRVAGGQAALVHKIKTYRADIRDKRLVQ